MSVIIFLFINQALIISFLIYRIIKLKKENQFLQQEKNSMIRIIEFDKSINW
jgi:predicted permease